MKIQKFPAIFCIGLSIVFCMYMNVIYIYIYTVYL